MFATIHTASGLLIASKVSNPVWIFFIGIISHFLLDIIPHGDRYLEKGVYETGKTRQKAIIRMILITIFDLLLSLSLFFVVLKINNFVDWQLYIIALIAVLLPDISMGLGKITYVFHFDNSNNFFIKLNLKLYKYHLKIHNLIPLEIPLASGIVFQLFLAGLFIYLI